MAISCSSAGTSPTRCSVSPGSCTCCLASSRHFTSPSVVQQVEQLAPVYLEAADEHAQVAVGGLCHLLEYVPCRQYVQSGVDLCLCGCVWPAAHHGEGLAGACLPVREAGRLSPLEDEGHQGRHGAQVYELVGLLAVEGVVEHEGLRLDHLGEIDLRLGLVDQHLPPPSPHLHHISISCRQLLPRQGSLPHHYPDSHISDRQLLL
eukprot:CAMPEP_0173354466 /NCGR_PEP_ID=MMETSP1144-20121109/17202_1 /TAXON_ID=483371 /ORGANISM="non described non described, Strain CCMP2298" /LENGTH=204 /DNA_ID=CAMNT_0014303021 /DNA_START=453 /DNA_END=1062 /DNA_ORIENTATION=+